MCSGGKSVTVTASKYGSGKGSPSKFDLMPRIMYVEKSVIDLVVCLKNRLIGTWHSHMLQWSAQEWLAMTSIKTVATTNNKIGRAEQLKTWIICLQGYSSLARWMPCRSLRCEHEQQDAWSGVDPRHSDGAGPFLPSFGLLSGWTLKEVRFRSSTSRNVMLWYASSRLFYDRKESGTSSPTLVPSRVF